MYKYSKLGFPLIFYCSTSMQCMLVYHTCMLVERSDVVFYFNAFCQREVDSLNYLVYFIFQGY